MWPGKGGHGWRSWPSSGSAAFDNDTLGLRNGYSSYRTKNFLLQLVDDLWTLASLGASNNPDFDFQPRKSFLAYRAANGKYQPSDIIFKYRSLNSTN